MIDEEPRDLGPCRACLARRATDLHHAVPRSFASRKHRDDPRNQLPLCHDCHMGWHAGTTIIFRDAFTDEEWHFVRTLTFSSWFDRRYPPRPPPGGIEGSR